MKFSARPAASARPDSIKATRTLLADDGALARFPGAVALVNPDGAVICANAAGARIQAVLGGGTQRLAAAVAEAIATGDDCTVTLVLPAAEGGDQLQLKLSILPLAKGEAALVMDHSAPIGAASIGAAASARRRYKDLLSLTGDFAWETNAAGVFTFVSEDGGFGWPAEAMVGRRAAEFLAELSAGRGPVPGPGPGERYSARVPPRRWRQRAHQRRGDAGAGNRQRVAGRSRRCARGHRRRSGAARGELVHFVDDEFERAAMPRQATG